MTEERFKALMKKHVGEIGGAGRTCDEIEADILADDPGFFTGRYGRELLRVLLTVYYAVPEKR